jgi:DNA polymerase-3 subunit gamma/tau
MFENLLGQDQATRALVSAIRSGQVPPAILLEGPEWSGRGTAALELGRALSCEAEAEWNCPCASCEAHRRMAHPDLLIAGPKPFAKELMAASAALVAACAENPGRATAQRYLFARAVRKLEKRFDQPFAESDDSRAAKAQQGVIDCEEALAPLLPGEPPLDADAAAKASAAAIDAALKLWTQGGYESIPVAHVRAISAWARLAPSGRAKLVIIEGAETMNDSCANALLKLLEEAPAHVRLALCATRGSVLPVTLLSRLRRLRFVERQGPDKDSVLEKIFKCQPPLAPSLKAFFDESSPGLKRLPPRAAEAFIAYAASRAEPPCLALYHRFLDLWGEGLEEEFALLIKAFERGGDSDAKGGRELFKLFLARLADALAIALRDAKGPVDCLSLAAASRAIEEARVALTLNLGIPATLESLLYELSRAMARPS